MKRRRVWLILAVAAAMVLALGVPLLAAEGRGESVAPTQAEALTGDIALAQGLVDGAAGVVTGSSTYDSTTLTKYIPASAFVPDLRGGVSDNDQFTRQWGCISPEPDTEYATASGYAPVELPNGALLTGVTFYGKDSDAAVNMTFDIWRNQFKSGFGFPPPPPTLVDGDLVASATTTGSPGVRAWFVDVNPDLAAGSTGFFLASTQNWFTITVDLKKAAGTNHKFCGAIVSYKVPSTGDNQTFTPLTPCAIFDSRTSQGGTGTFAANEKRDITVTGDTSAIGGEGDCGIPTTATAVQVNVLVLSPTGTGTLKAWAQGATEPAGLVAVSNDLPRWNGSSTVPIATNDQMSVKMKNTAAEVRLVVTGYFSSVSNMGN